MAIFIIFALFLYEITMIKSPRQDKEVSSLLSSSKKTSQKSKLLREIDTIDFEKFKKIAKDESLSLKGKRKLIFKGKKTLSKVNKSKNSEEINYNIQSRISNIVPHEEIELTHTNFKNLEIKENSTDISKDLNEMKNFNDEFISSINMPNKQIELSDISNKNQDTEEDTKLENFNDLNEIQTNLLRKSPKYFHTIEDVVKSVNDYSQRKGDKKIDLITNGSFDKFMKRVVDMIIDNGEKKAIWDILVKSFPCNILEPEINKEKCFSYIEGIEKIDYLNFISIMNGCASKKWD